MIILAYCFKAPLGEEPTDIPYIVNGLILREHPSYASYVFEQDPCSAGPAGVFDWKQVNSLDDHSLFLGLNYPIIANLKDAEAPNGEVVPFMRKNCVYTPYPWFYGNEFPKIFRCNLQADEIGRASCRERVCQYV